MIRKSLGFLIGLLLLVLVSGAGVAESAKVNWKLQSAYAKTLPCSGDLVPKIAEDISIATNGEIGIQMFDPGALVGALEILDAVSAGKVDAGFAVSGFWEGKLPAASIFSSVPFGPETPEFISWLYYGNGLKLYQEMYDRGKYNVKVLPAAMLVPETAGWFSKPIKSPADLKGLKMRFFGLGGKAMEKLGVSTSLLPPGEVFAALEKGAVDAAEQSIPIIDRRLGFYKVVKYNYFPGWHQQSTVLELLVNKDRWNALTKSQQKVIELATHASMVWSIAYGEGAQAPIIKENAEKFSVKNMYWSDEMLAAFEKAWKDVLAEQRAKDEFFNKVWQDLDSFRTQYRTWGSLGFLPRKKAE